MVMPELLRNDPGECLRSERYHSIQTQEEELLALIKQKGKGVKFLQEQLMGAYRARGMNREEVLDFLGALLEKNNERRQEVLLGLAGRFETAGQFAWAAQEYFEAKDFNKAAAMWINSGRIGPARNFLFAAECLIKTGQEKEEAYGVMAEEAKEYINRTREEHGYGYRLGKTESYGVLGECLHAAGDTQGALIAFKKTAGDDQFEQLRVEASYLETIGDWQGAFRAMKELIDEFESDNYENLARLANKAGLRKEEVKALWRGGRYLESARMVAQETGNKEIFKEAAKLYDKQGSIRTRDFFYNVWKETRSYLFRKFLNPDTPPEETYQKTLDLIEFVYSAYSLTPPVVEQINLSLTTLEHQKKADELYREFSERKKTTKKKDLPNLFLEPTFAKMVVHAALGRLSFYKLGDVLRWGFVGMAFKRPIESSLSPELQEIWGKAKEREKWVVGGDSVEMAARVYEEGGYFKEAKARYLKANLFDDAKRMEELIYITK